MSPGDAIVDTGVERITSPHKQADLPRGSGIQWLLNAGQLLPRPSICPFASGALMTSQDDLRSKTMCVRNSSAESPNVSHTKTWPTARFMTRTLTKPLEEHALLRKISPKLTGIKEARSCRLVDEACHDRIRTQQDLDRNLKIGSAQIPSRKEVGIASAVEDGQSVGLECLQAFRGFIHLGDLAAGASISRVTHRRLKSIMTTGATGKLGLEMSAQNNGSGKSSSKLKWSLYADRLACKRGRTP